VRTGAVYEDRARQVCPTRGGVDPRLRPSRPQGPTCFGPRIIVVGSTRYKAALQLGLGQVPVHVAAGLTPAQVKAYRLANNKTAELAEWNTRA
jgi:hypothetical protein